VYTVTLIAAIDPGPEESAWIRFETDGLRIVDFAKESNETVLELIKFWGHQGDTKTLVIEQIASFGMPVGAEVFETCVWTGRFMERWGGPCDRIKRHEVKTHLCHSPRAKDGNIRAALIDKLGPQGKKASPGPTYGISGDVWAALSVAVTWAETRSGVTMGGG
jgi:hypothetical protein